MREKKRKGVVMYIKSDQFSYTKQGLIAMTSWQSNLEYKATPQACVELC